MTPTVEGGIWRCVCLTEPRTRENPRSRSGPGPERKLKVVFLIKVNALVASKKRRLAEENTVLK